MPIFEFTCPTCGKEFERLVYGSDEAKVVCPSCGCEDAKKLLSVFSCSSIERSLQASCGSHSPGGS